MIKRGLKNFFISFKYILTPLGMLFVGLVVGLSVFVPVAFSAISDFAKAVTDVLENMSVDPQLLIEEIFDCAAKLDWSDPIDAFWTLISPEWLEDTLRKCIESIGEANDFDSISEAMDGTVSTISAGFSSFVAICFLSIIGGYYILKSQIRSAIAKRAFWKVALAYIFESLVATAVAILSVYLASLWKLSLIFSFIVGVLLVGGVAIAEAYVLHGVNKVPFKEVFNLKNICMLALTTLIIFLIWLAISLFAIYVINAVVGITLCLVVLEIAIIVVGLNAESYVKDYADKNSSAA